MLEVLNGSSRGPANKQASDLRLYGPRLLFNFICTIGPFN